MPRGPSSSQASSRRTTPSRTRAATRDPSKVVIACLTCRQRKVKCSGTNPCSYCSKRALDCSFSEHGKRRAYSVARIEYLEARLASYENATPVLSPVSQTVEAVRPRLEETHARTKTRGPSRTRRSSIRIGNNAFLVDSLGLPAVTRPELEENVPTCASEPLPGSAIAADSSLSSSYAFGSRVQSLLDGSKPAAHRDYAAYTTDQLSLHQQSRSTHVFDIPSLPTEQEAFGLLETLVTYIGHTQNYVDAREISDKIGLLYANKQDSANSESLWTLEILLICAIARLFKGDFGGDAHRTDPYPGYALFNFARDRIPPLGQLYSVGRVGVEVLALVAVYLQNIYCKEEAYLYISTALRLAVSHGYHRQSATGRLLQSEATHINRLWWSIYSQERRIAAATGSPQGISDSVIEQPLPTDSIGFTPAAPMRTSIKLARVYGRIMTVLYGSTVQTEDTFISNVQSIIRSLYDISDEIPLELATGMPKLGHELSLRTSAALHLMFYQALLLTIRPVMLHIAQLILTGKSPQPGILYSSPSGKLCRTCTEAARRLLKVLMTLRQHNCIALFGFFDFDGIFSVTFIMILTAILDSACKDPSQQIHPAPGLAEALDLVKYVADSHNTFAAQWLCEITRTWAQLCTRLDMPEGYRAIDRRLELGSAASTTAAAAAARPRSRPSPREILPLDATEPVNASSSSSFPARAGHGHGPVHSYEETTTTTPFRSSGEPAAGPNFLNGDAGGASDPQSQSILADLDIWSDINHLWGPLPEDWGEMFQGQNQNQNPNQDESDEGTATASAIPQSLYQNIYGSREWTFTGEDMGDFAELGRHVGGAL